ncbi:hypothetical protein [Moorena sp. SIO3A2]|uniref:hypothetical protein n=1 Tax=Moorena sp. SIO3A2 TaxID=2607841 RepID=UPI0013B75431|nr:hypothetical protein [Moorena sp. SIO3A2]NER88445.1 hypothetical protein [Moorena sp. SIO3A2]
MALIPIVLYDYQYSGFQLVKYKLLGFREQGTGKKSCRIGILPVRRCFGAGRMPTLPVE